MSWRRVARHKLPIALVAGRLIAAFSGACAAPAGDPDAEPSVLADVVSVNTSAAAGAYRFDVGVRSPDLGCRQYADWWEVLRPTGELVHRRVLAHSHVAEQPFVRSAAPVAVMPEQVVWVRAHMEPSGYGGVAFRGSVAAGFEAAQLPAGFAAELAERAPLPPPCAR